MIFHQIDSQQPYGGWVMKEDEEGERAFRGRAQYCLLQEECIVEIGFFIFITKKEDEMQFYIYSHSFFHAYLICFTRTSFHDWFCTYTLLYIYSFIHHIFLLSYIHSSILNFTYPLFHPQFYMYFLPYSILHILSFIPGFIDTFFHTWLLLPIHSYMPSFRYTLFHIRQFYPYIPSYSSILPIHSFILNFAHAFIFHYFYTHHSFIHYFYTYILVYLVVHMHSCILGCTHTFLYTWLYTYILVYLVVHIHSCILGCTHTMKWIKLKLLVNCFICWFLRLDIFRSFFRWD